MTNYNNMTVKELENEIKKNATLYYEGEPEISDYDFDKMVDTLKEKDPDNKLLTTVGWGYEVNNPLNRTDTHSYEVAKFEDKIKNSKELGLKPDDGIISVKIDGGSIICYYEKGVMKKALTRGDGKTGYLVTKKMKLIAPTKLKDRTFTGLVRGEIAMKNTIFNNKYSFKYKSARNLAIGLIKRDNLSMEQIRDLSFVAYTVRGKSTKKLDSKQKVFNWLKENDFECVDILITKHWDDESFRKLIKTYDKYPIDGIVVTSNKYTEQSDGTHIPVREVAYKTGADTAEVVVTDILWNLTRTGNLFPTAKFTKVKLSGAEVEKATAFNAKYMKDEGLGIGSKILIQRSGEVIPDIMRVITKAEDYKLPEVCPKCGNPLIWKGVHLHCNNPDCKGNAYNALEHWILKITELKGLGESIIDNFTNMLDINDIPTLYKKLDLVPNLFDKTSATRKLMEKMIELLRAPIPFGKFMIACNIPMVGQSASEELEKYQDLILKDKIDDAWEMKIQAMGGCNVTAKKNIIDNIDKIRQYSKYVNIESGSDIDNSTNSSISDDKVVAITGALSVPRTEFAKELANAGWKLATSITKKVKYLITDNPNSGSSKNKKAQDMGVKVISEIDFRKIMNK